MNELQSRSAPGGIQQSENTQDDINDDHITQLLSIKNMDKINTSHAYLNKALILRCTLKTPFRASGQRRFSMKRGYQASYDSNEEMK